MSRWLATLIHPIVVLLALVWDPGTGRAELAPRPLEMSIGIEREPEPLRGQKRRAGGPPAVVTAVTHAGAGPDPGESAPAAAGLASEGRSASLRPRGDDEAALADDHARPPFRPPRR